MKDKSKYFFIGVLLISLFLAALPMLRGTIYFHVDIARDFLLLEDIVSNHKITLIGPRSGGIPGVFHGPLWLYLNIPFYIFSGGDPVGVGFGWLIMWALGVFVAWYSFKKVVDEKVALITTAMYALITCTSVSNFFNPSGAMLVAPIWFSYLLLYAKESKWRYLVFVFVSLGLMIQFQMAFGIPAVLLTALYLIYLLVKSKKWNHGFAIFAIVPFVSTFIVFDLRHEFLQTKAVLSYVFGSVQHGKLNLPVGQFLITRFVETILKLYGFITQNNTLLIASFILLTVWAGYLIIKNRRHTQNNTNLSLFLFMWFGYWTFTLPYKGVMWDYYLLPFLPLSVLFVVILLHRLPKKFKETFIIVWIIGLCVFQSVVVVSRVQKAHQVRGEWMFMKNTLEKVMFDSNAPRQFGYFIFTLDQLGYDPDYALHFLAKTHPDFNVRALSKEKTTYLFVDTESHPRANKDYWRSQQVNINKKPEKIFVINETLQIEKYSLTEEEMTIPFDQNLIQNLIFR